MAVLLGCAATGRAPSAPSPLGDADARLYARILAATDARRSDTAAVGTGMRAGHPRLRRFAVRAAGQLRDTTLLPHLHALLADADTGVAAEAAFALGLIRDSASVGPLSVAVRRPGPAAADAAWSLGEIGAPARGAIVTALAAPPSDGEAIVELLIAASKLRPVPAEVVVPFATRLHPAGVVWAAAYAIARPRAPAGVRALLDLEPRTHRDSMWLVGLARDHVPGYATEPNLVPQIRVQIARGLAKQAAGDSLAARALDALGALARDAHPHVRINAARSLASYGADARRPLLALVRDADPNVRIAVAQSLGGILPAERAAWREVWDADTAFAFRREVAASAVRSGVVLHAIDEDNPDNWQRNPDWRYRAAAADAGSSATLIERVVEVSLPLTRDRDGRVRAAAYGAFTPWLDSAGADQHPWRRTFLMPALRDEDPYVRATVLAGLAGAARAAELPAVLASYRLALADTPNDARLAGVRYLAAAWRRDSASIPDSIRRQISGLERPEDPLVRGEAGDASIFSSWADRGGTARPESWYEGIVRTYVAPAQPAAPTLRLLTDRGPITLELFASDAPLTVDNFLSLARTGYYDGARFHRVVPNFVVQDGDPRGDGSGGPGYAIRDELNRRRYRRGAVGMALSGPDTGGSQYFIALSPQPHLDGHYTVFGRVLGGLDALDAIVRDDRIQRIELR